MVKSLLSLKVEFEFGVLGGAFLKERILTSLTQLLDILSSCVHLGIIFILKWNVAEAAHVFGMRISLKPLLHPSSKTCQCRSRATLLAEHALALRSQQPSGSPCAWLPPWKTAYFTVTFVPGDTSR